MIVIREEKVMPYFKSSFSLKGERYNNIETSENQTKSIFRRVLSKLFIACATTTILISDMMETSLMLYCAHGQAGCHTGRRGDGEGLGNKGP
jgi:hypothetical protein